MKPRCKAEMMRTWEEKVKYKFGNSSDYDYDISVMGIPDDDDTNVEDGFHTIYREDVQKIFDPVVDRIIELVNHQVDEIEKKGENLAVNSETIRQWPLY